MHVADPLGGASGAPCFTACIQRSDSPNEAPRVARSGRRGRVLDELSGVRTLGPAAEADFAPATPTPVSGAVPPPG